MHAVGYRFHGFSIASDLALPELLPEPASSPAGPALVSIARGADSLLDELPVEAYEVRVSPDDGHRFLLPEGGVLAVGPAGEGRYAARPELAADLLRHVLIGQLLPNALALAPSPVAAVLHASVVRFGDQAVAFVGEGGIGKSSLAAACHAAGLTVLCDDCAPVVADAAGALRVRPGLARLKLWDDAVAAFGLEALVVGPIHAGSPKRLLRLPQADAAALPLACVYHLQAGAGPGGGRPAGMAVRALTPAESMARLYQQCFGHRRQSVAGRARHFTQVGTIATAVPQHELAARRGLSELPALIDALQERHQA